MLTQSAIIILQRKFAFYLLNPFLKPNLRLTLLRQGQDENSRFVFTEIDLFSLYILFSHFRPRDATRGNSFFQMSSYARANLRITNEKTKGKFP